MAVTLDLNSDLGEGFGTWRLGDDFGLLALVTSANVACGFHAGDPTIMRRVCERAAANGVAVGAHVSYRDLAGFGRRSMDVEPGQLADEVTYQLAALDGIARTAGTRVSYVKPHGALYNRIVHDGAQAGAVVAAVRAYDPGLPLLGLPGSAVLAQAAAAGLTAVAEAFADRAYLPDGRLAPRGTPGAVITDPAEVVRRCVALATTGEVTGVDGDTVRVEARSLCVHGDTPGAVELAGRIREALVSAGVTLAPFA
ncbi:5-oxoprolinase subunit PxpA [Micromonospora sp. NPDC049559]|uniref:LamB/YcsF family protein n=1 Tax=Micromonospora sp. NPDC049559 TaxID=3155923 RepID=UPI00343386AE